MDTTFTATLSADMFRRVAIGQSTDPTRFYLCGVYVQPCKHGGAILAATDGNLMIVAHDASAIIGDDSRDKAGVIVALPKDLLKHCKEGAFLRLKDGAAAVETPQGASISAAGVLVDGSFPDWRRVVPGVTETPSAATYDAWLITRLGEALTESAKGLRVLTINAKDPLSPGLVFGTQPNMFGVVMPVRRGPEPYKPAWLD